MPSDLAALKHENSRRLRAELARGETVLTALPEIVTLNSTDICNLRCVMCPRNLAQGTYRLDDRVVRHVCAELFPTALKANLTTAGGEPLGPGFDVILENARRHGVLIDVVTNGVRMNRETFREMRPLLDHLNVSVDCSIPAIYERLRLGASFERLVGNLRAMAEVREDGADDLLFSMSAVVMASNLPHLAALVRFAAEHGAGGVVLQRLRHEIKPTWDEEPATHFRPAEIERFLGQAAEAAREHGVNLYQRELGRSNLFHRPQRPKTPDTIDDAGVCYFLAQSFSVMYTGEVYPCCKPTDYMLGDVRRQSPIEIWNGAPLVRLRAAHFARRGTLFCSGCEYAPHLPARGDARWVEIARRARRVRAHVWNGIVRRLSARRGSSAFAPAVPRHERLSAVNGAHVLPALTAEALPGRREASALDPRDGALWFVHSGVLHRATPPEAEPTAIAELPCAGGTEVSGLCMLADGALLVSFERSGTVLRVDADEVAARSVLVLSDPRSCVRTQAMAAKPDGTVWLGEYGVHPGARCAAVYRSDDGGRSFARAAHVSHARHVHALACAPGGGILFTTGDLADEQRAYALRAGAAPRALLGPWAGFTAIAFSGGYVHLGTDLAAGNGFVRARLGSAGGLGALRRSVRELRPLEGSLDLQVRQIEHLGGGRLVALGGLDENLRAEHAERRPALFLSADHGASWACVHRFRDDWADAPERLVVLSPGRVLTDHTDHPQILLLPRDGAR
jgi:MoaA/NifB/PqqE/SkfB family radical SAM enzyme